MARKEQHKHFMQKKKVNKRTNICIHRKVVPLQRGTGVTRRVERETAGFFIQSLLVLCIFILTTYWDAHQGEGALKGQLNMQTLKTPTGHWIRFTSRAICQQSSLPLRSLWGAVCTAVQGLFLWVPYWQLRNRKEMPIGWQQVLPWLKSLPPHRSPHLL